MSDVNVVKVEGKPLEKLIDVISKGIGTIYKPRAIRKEAEAKAYEIEIIERAKAKALSEGKLIEADTIDKIQERVIYKETRRQENIENVTQIAAQQLSQEESVSDEPVDDDWTTRFFNIIEDISNEEMQVLWGRILAGEIKQPKSYSLRTLDVLKNLTFEEANIFTKFAQIKLTAGDTNMIYNQDNGAFLESEFGITFKDRLLLTELGFIASENNLEFSFFSTQAMKINFIEYGKKGIFLKREANTPKQAISVLVFTKIGVELSKLIEQTTNENYIKKVCSGFKHPNVKITYGDLLNFPDGTVRLFNPIEYQE